MQNKTNALREELIQFVEKNGVALPESITITPHGRYRLGECQMEIGQVGKFYYFCFETNDQQTRAKIFESKEAFHLFFIQLKGMDAKDIGFYRQEIDAIKNRGV